MRSALRKLLLGLSLSAGLLLLVELILRLTVPMELLQYTWERPDGLIELAGSYTMVRANHQETHPDGPYSWQERTNSARLREDHEIPLRKPRGSERILALGDSWMFGISITQGKTIPDQLEGLLPARLGASSVEVMNAGVPGGSAFDMLARWRELGTTYELDGVLLGLPHNEAHQRKLEPVRSWFYEHRGGAPFIDLRIYLLLRRWLARFTRAEAPQLADQGPNSPVVQDLLLIASEALARDLPVWLVTWPTGWVAARMGAPHGGREVVAAMEPLGVPHVGHALDSRCCWGFEDDNHPGEAGARAIAELVADMIADGRSSSTPIREPRCEDVPGIGPGKPGSPR